VSRFRDSEYKGGSLPQLGVTWSHERAGSFQERTEECYHRYEIENELSPDEKNREVLNFTVWRTMQPSRRAPWLALVYDGRVVASASGVKELEIEVEDGFDMEMSTSLFESHVRSFEEPDKLGEYVHKSTSQPFVASRAGDGRFVASNYIGVDTSNLRARTDYEKTIVLIKGGVHVSTRARVRVVPIDTSDHAYGRNGYTVNYSNIPTENTFLMTEEVTCVERSRVSLKLPLGSKYRATMRKEFEEVSPTKRGVEKKDMRSLQDSTVPVSPFLPNGLQWYSNKVALEYTLDTIRFLGLEFYLRVTASLFYDGVFQVYVALGESNLGIDLEFYAYRSSETGGAMITLLDREILDIDPIPLFTIGPLTLEIKPGLRLISKLNLAGTVNQIYLALRNEIHVFAEVTISTPCMVVIKFSLGIRVSGRIMRIEHQFGFYSQDAGLNIASALVEGTACMELRYAQLPFSIVIEPICRICVGFLRCKKCFGCLGSLLSSLALYLTFGSMTTDIIYSSCNEGIKFTNYPPSSPPLPSPPPSPPYSPPPPWRDACYGGPCNDDAECSSLGTLWACNQLMPWGTPQGTGLGTCYDFACDVTPPTSGPRRRSPPKPPRPPSLISAPPPPP